MKFRTFFDAPSLPGEVNKEPSCTVTDGYEDLETMVARILRGEPAPRVPQSFELSGDNSEITDEDFDCPDVDHLDDLTDIDTAVEVIQNSVSASAKADTQSVTESTKHGAVEADSSAEASAEQGASDVGVSDL